MAEEQMKLRNEQVSNYITASILERRNNNIKKNMEAREMHGHQNLGELRAPYSFTHPPLFLTLSNTYSTGRRMLK